MNSNELTADEKKKAKDDFLNLAHEINRYKCRQHVRLEQAIEAIARKSFSAFQDEGFEKGYKVDLICRARSKLLKLTDRETKKVIIIGGQQSKPQTTKAQPQEKGSQLGVEFSPDNELLTVTSIPIPIPIPIPTQTTIIDTSHSASYLKINGRPDLPNNQTRTVSPVQPGYQYGNMTTSLIPSHYSCAYQSIFYNTGLLLNPTLQNLIPDGQTSTTQTTVQANKRLFSAANIPEVEQVPSQRQKLEASTSPHTLFPATPGCNQKQESKNLPAPATAKTTPEKVESHFSESSSSSTYFDSFSTGNEALQSLSSSTSTLFNNTNTSVFLPEEPSCFYELDFTI